ncbi:MAG: glycosyltransferase family 4 protein, partial [Anaerolineales bacterium]
MRILQVSQRFHLRGGSDRHFFDLIDLLRANGHEVIPFAAQDPNNQETDQQEWFPEAIDFENPSLSDLGLYVYSRPARRAISQVLDQFRPDVVHLHIYYGKLTSSILQPIRERGIPIVQTLHEYKLICPVYTLVSNGEICEACQGHRFYQAVLRRCNRGSLRRSMLSAVESYVSRWLGAVEAVDEFIAPSDFVRDKMVQYGLPDERMTRIYNFNPTPKADPLETAGDYVIYFGRLEPVKGVFEFLEAVGSLGLPALVVGEGSAKVALVDRAQRQGWDHVQFRPFLPFRDLQPLIRNCAFSVLPAKWYEPFGLTILESYAAGRPVVASAIGGIPEVVNNGVSGLLVTPGDTEELRDAIEHLWLQVEERQEMGRRG